MEEIKKGGEGMSGDVDWLAIQTEYITTDTTYRALAAKHGLHYKKIGDVGRREGWVAQREQHRNKTLTAALDAIGQDNAGRARRMHDAAGDLIDKIAVWVEQLDPEEMDTKSVRQICSSLLDLKQLLDIRPEEDWQEQRARIANLERQAQQRDAGRETVQVVLGPGLEELCR